jgi:hypothetical protein
MAQPATQPNVNPLVSDGAIAAGAMIPKRAGASYPIPEKLNLALAGIQFTAALALLYIASQTAQTGRVCLLAVVFAYADGLLPGSRSSTRQVTPAAKSE